MSEKVILPRDVAEAVESYPFGKDMLVRAFCDTNGVWDEEFRALNKIDLTTLMSALVNGYEVGTPEEVAHRKVREYYEELKTNREISLQGSRFFSSHTDHYRQLTSQMVAVRKTLNLLGITIEGINGTND